MNDSFELFVCPVCRKPLFCDNQALKCENRHSFDIATVGYVNLALTGKDDSGDSKLMVTARHNFLQSGYYGCLKESLTKLSADICIKSCNHYPSIIDAGCGEGYYSAGVYEGLKNREIDVLAAGFDISKSAVKTAAKRGSGMAFAVASAYELPVRDCCADIVLSVFAPLCADEFKRVLKPGGSLIIAAPGKRHLFALKQVLYDEPYENDKNVFALDGYENVDVRYVNQVITLTCTEDINSLFAMTPYYWKTPQEGSRRLGELASLTTEIEFELHVLRKT
jgi:23S rRNA (guanine745-N1)-methyltransferase